MSSYLERACKKYGVGVDKALAYAEVGDEFVLVLDLGPAGCPKYRIPLAELTDEQLDLWENAPEPGPEVVEEPEVEEEMLPVPAAIDLGYQDLEKFSYRDLQDLAKAHDIPANQSADALREALAEVYDAG